MDANKTRQRLRLFVIALTLGNFTPQVLAEVPTGDQIRFSHDNAETTMHDLVSFATDTAKKQLGRTGGFTPFGITITQDGYYRIHYGTARSSKHDVTNMVSDYRKLAGDKRIVAATVVYNARIRFPDEAKAVDAIYVKSDSLYTRPHNGYAIYYRASGGYKFGEMVRMQTDVSGIFN